MTVPDTRRAELRKGWCPGALRPMETGDGLLVRIRPRGGRMSIVNLLTVAGIAARHGSGAIDLTSRANLQLRGLDTETYPDALQDLRTANLVDDDVRSEALRNIVVDPLAGLEPGRADVAAIAHDLERRLTAEAQTFSLSDKFGISISGAGQSLGGAPADIQVFLGTDRDAVIAIDGNEGLEARVSAETAVDAVLALVRAFNDLSAGNPDVRRMRHLAADAHCALGARAGLELSAGSPSHSAPATGRFGCLGPMHAPTAVVIGLPFGRISADDLAAIGAAALSVNVSEVRFSPMRALVFPATTAAAAQVLLSMAKALGLVTETSDPRWTMDVCPGANGCRNGTTDTRADANRLSESLKSTGERLLSIHISGCEKGCARRTAADWTFVARDGVYDLVRHGTVTAAPLMRGVEPDGMAHALTEAAR